MQSAAAFILGIASTLFALCIVANCERREWMG